MSKKPSLRDEIQKIETFLAHEAHKQEIQWELIQNTQLPPVAMLKRTLNEMMASRQQIEDRISFALEHFE